MSLYLRTLLFGYLVLCTAVRTQAGGPYRMVLQDSLVRGSDGEAGLLLDNAPTENTRLISSSLAVLLGPFAAHRIYMGTTPKVAIVYGVTFGGFGVLALIDLGHLLFTKDLDRFKNSDRVFMWTAPREATTPP